MVAGVTHRRIEGLDLIRGFAILLVVVRHSWPEFLGGGGIVGVVVFFTLSGYLITGLLVADLRAYGRVRYGRFYRNRAIRLLPALAALLVVFVIVEGVIDLAGTRDSVFLSLLVAVTYTMNIPGFDHGSPNLSHLWTLANEEQFYLVWPLVLALGIRLRRLKSVVIAVALIMLAALVASVFVAMPEYGRLYSLPTTWTISMIVGSAAQLGQQKITRFLTRRRAHVAGVMSAAGLIALSFIPDAKGSVVMYLGGGLLIGVLTVALIWALRDVGTVTRAARPLLWLGTVSYAAYLWNYPLTWWMRELGNPLWAPSAAALTVVAAAASWFAVERPFNQWRKRLDQRVRRLERDPVRADEAVRV